MTKNIKFTEFGFYGGVNYNGKNNQTVAVDDNFGTYQIDMKSAIDMGAGLRAGAEEKK